MYAIIDCGCDFDGNEQKSVQSIVGSGINIRILVVEVDFTMR